jgi:ribosome-binding protein aMBF1 (putative translation factor)
MTILAKKLHQEWLKDSTYRDAYEAIAPEYAIARELIAARARAGLSQAELAKLMGTTQSAVARIESGKQKLSTRTLERYAQATGSLIKISLVPSEKAGA